MFTTLTYQGIQYPQFEVSDDGILRNVHTGHTYKSITGNTGYKTVNVSLGSRKNRKTFRIHRCVAESFIQKIPGKEIINHIDGNKTNNAVQNLEWCTPSENMRHAVDCGLLVVRSGESNAHAVLTQEQANWIREVYVPYDREYGTRGLGRRFNVDHEVISNIVNGIRYNQA